jgi:hypothetical protein
LTGTRTGTGGPGAADEPVYMRASVGSQDKPPDRTGVESCVDRAALVPVAGFDHHGQCHLLSPESVQG